MLVPVHICFIQQMVSDAVICTGHTHSEQEMYVHVLQVHIKELLNGKGFENITERCILTMVLKSLLFIANIG